MRPKSKGEEEFINQMTRRVMVQWADHLVKNPMGSVPVSGPCIYHNHALSKGWITKKEPRRLTSKGWGVAAAFLKR